MSEDLIFIMNVCVPDKKLHLCIVNFSCKICKFWRGEKKEENTANVALKCE